MHCRHGAEEVEPTGSGASGRSQAFQGGGYRLGDAEGASLHVIGRSPSIPDRPQVTVQAVGFSCVSTAEILNKTTSSSEQVS